MLYRAKANDKYFLWMYVISLLGFLSVPVFIFPFVTLIIIFFAEIKFVQIKKHLYWLLFLSLCVLSYYLVLGLINGSKSILILDKEGQNFYDVLFFVLYANANWIVGIGWIGCFIYYGSMVFLPFLNAKRYESKINSRLLICSFIILMLFSFYFKILCNGRIMSYSSVFFVLGVNVLLFFNKISVRMFNFIILILIFCSNFWMVYIRLNNWQVLWWYESKADQIFSTKEVYDCKYAGNSYLMMYVNYQRKRNNLPPVHFKSGCKDVWQPDN